MTTTFKKGDIVCHKAEFLRSIGWHTNVPINGKVLEACPNGVTALHWETPTKAEPVRIPSGVAVVQWNDQKDPVLIRMSNLILFSERHLEPA